MKSLNAVFILVLAFGSYAFAQNPSANRQKDWRISEAYVVLVKEKAQAKGNLYEAAASFNSEAVQVKTAAFRVALIEREIKKLYRTNARSAMKYSAAFGDLLLTKIQYEVELYKLRQEFTPEYIAVKKKEVQLTSIKADINRISKNLR